MRGHAPVYICKIAGANKIFFLLSAGSNTFTVADPKLKVLEDSTFCSNGRIICHEEGMTVEVRVAKVVPATEMDVPPGYKQINQ